MPGCAERRNYGLRVAGMNCQAIARLGNKAAGMLEQVFISAAGALVIFLLFSLAISS
jgi:hypothetical protein